jgi:FkbH-like protein
MLKMSGSGIEKPWELDHPTTLVELLKVRAATQAEMVGYSFLVDGEIEQGRVSYSQLDIQARAVAAWLQKAGLAGQRAILIYPSGFDLLSAFFGCLYSGVIPIPYPLSNLRRESSTVRFVYRDAEPAVALTTHSQLPGIQRGLERHSIRMLLLATDSIPLELAEEWADPQLSADCPAYLQYTSGSASLPKGVVITHSNVLHNLSYIDAGFEHSNTSASVTWLPYFHDMGLVYGLLQPLYNGFPCWIMSPTAFAHRPLRWLQAISRFRATHSGAPNFAYDLCVRAANLEGRLDLDLSHWEVAFVGAEPIRSETLERFSKTFGAVGFCWKSFYPAYGLAEATLKVTGGSRGAGPVLLNLRQDCLENNQVVETEATGPGVKTLVGCGNASHGVEIAIVHPDTGTPCSELQVGEVWVTGPGNARGYWNQPEETQRTFRAQMPERNEPFLRTGDLGFLRDGALFVTGRNKDLIIIRGQNHYPQDIEHTVESCCPLLLGQAVAFSITVDGQEKVVILKEVRSRRQSSSDFRDVLQTIRQAVANEHDLEVYTVALVPQGKLLKTSSGKIRRRACQAAFLNGEIEVIASESLRLEADVNRPKLSRAELLGIQDPIYRRDRLVAYIVEAAVCVMRIDRQHLDPSLPPDYLALDSLNAVALQVQIEEILDISLPPLIFLQNRSIQAVATRALELVEQSSGRGSERELISSNHQPRENYPLSFEQERIWILSYLMDGGCAYNLSFSFRIHGRLNVTAFQQSLNDLLHRQPALRSAFPIVDGGPVQRVCELTAISLPYVDLSNSPRKEQESLLKGIAREIQEKRFDLSTGPLLHCCLAKTEVAEHTFLVAIHHIISDAASFEIFLKELALIYEARSKGDLYLSPPVSPGYLDFVIWQRNWHKNANLRAKGAFWRDRLTPPPAQIHFPGEKLYESSAVTAKEEESVVIPGEVLSALKELSRQEGVTLFMALLTIFKATLSLYTGQTDILIASPISGRTRPETRPIIGFFAYPVLLRTDLSGDPSFLEILQRVRNTVLAALANADIPFVAIIESLPSSQIRNPKALTDVMFNFVNADPTPIVSDGITMGPIELQRPTTDIGIFFNLLTHSDGLQASLTYDTDRFSAETARAILTLYSGLMKQVVIDPGAKLSRSAPSPTKPDNGKITIASTFVAAPIKDVLEFWLDELDLSWQIEFAAYGQVMQSLLDPDSSFLHIRTGVRVLLIRLEDWLGGGSEELQRTVQEFVRAVEAVVERGGPPILVGFCPATPGLLEDEALSQVLHDLEGKAAEELVLIGGVEVVTHSQITNLYPVAKYDDPILNASAHVPYLPQWFAAMGTMIIRKSYGLHFPPYKVIVVDCDDTLWGGVCSEDGSFGVIIDAERRALQEFLLGQQQNGMLLCLCSKNNLEDVRHVFQIRPEMILQWDEFVSTRINWEAKSVNLRSLAAELNIGLDSFIFIDDNPVECAEVQQNCPEVLTLQIGGTIEEALSLLKRNWAFDQVRNTPVAKLRTALYQAQHQRETLRRESPSLKEYLAGLNLTVSIRPMQPEDIARVSELTFRVNQFNFTSIRRSESDIHNLHAQGVKCRVVEVTDRFGPYGLVGALFFRERSGMLEIDTFLLSCRALGRGVEHSMLSELGRIAQQHGCVCVRLLFYETSKNSPARAFLEQTVGSFRQEINGRLLFDIPVESVCQVAYEPPSLEENDRNIAGERREGVIPTPHSRALQPVSRERLRRIAETLSDPDEILKAINTRKSERRAGGSRDGSGRMPGLEMTCIEKRLAAIWAEMLGVDSVREDENFFDLGGDSILAIQILSRVRDIFQVELPMTILFTSGVTVAELAGVIEQQLMKSSS